MTWKPFSSEREYDGFLRINSCGKRELRDREYDTFRPDGRIDYSLQYIREGVCEVELDGGMQPVEAGCLILYFHKPRSTISFGKGNGRCSCGPTSAGQHAGCWSHCELSGLW